MHTAQLALLDGAGSVGFPAVLSARHYSSNHNVHHESRLFKKIKLGWKVADPNISIEADECEWLKVLKHAKIA